MEYILEIHDWENWLQVGGFSSLEVAKKYGLNNYAQNDWRIMCDGNIVHNYDSLNAFEEIAKLEVCRIDGANDWNHLRVLRSQWEANDEIYLTQSFIRTENKQLLCKMDGLLCLNYLFDQLEGTTNSSISMILLDLNDLKKVANYKIGEIGSKIIFSKQSKSKELLNELLNKYCNFLYEIKKSLISINDFINNYKKINYWKEDGF